MELVPYLPAHLEDCMRLFDSNQGTYFTAEERHDYEQFLSNLSVTRPYYVVQVDSEIVAAGGFALDKDHSIRFTWGMVDNNLHGQGLGTFLVDERIKLIGLKYPNASICLDTSQHTIQFYQNLGFRVLSKTLNGYGPGLHKIEMCFIPGQKPESFHTALELFGHGLHLTPYQADDFEGLYLVASDPAIWAQHPASDRYQREVFKDYFASGLANGMAYLVNDCEGKCLIGSSRYHQPDFVTSTVEIGWTFLAVDCWGGAINAKLKDLMLKHAFDYFNKVHFCIGEDNKRSILAVKKLGAQYEPELYDAEKPDSVWYSLTPETYVGMMNYGQS